MRKVEAASREPDAQPLALRELLRSLNAARRQSSLYGSDHPSTQQTAEELSKVTESFLSYFGPSTFVFTEDALILNDNWYEPSSDSREMYRRLRSRGVMAVTLVDQPPAEQVSEFLAFLNIEPREIKRYGGASTYLRQHSVHKIVATDAIYTAGDQSDDDYQGADQPGEGEIPMDRSIAAVIAWLSRQEEEDGSPRFSTAEIFSQPDVAAKLIREAVTKLHSSRRSRPTGELATEVFNDLKDVVATSHEDWDGATQQIRQTISKLPKEMRPETAGFTSVQRGSWADDFDKDAAKVVDVADVEAMVNKILEDSAESDSQRPGDVSVDVEELFGATPTGLLSSWKAEMQPRNALQSSVRTLAWLMAWETNSAEHGQMARSLASLILRAIEMNDTQAALEFASKLVDEVCQEGQLPWRSVNAKSALQTVDVSVYLALIEEVLKTGDHRSLEIAASLVKAVPALALAASDMLQRCPSGLFTDSILHGIAASGRSAGPILSKFLTEGSPATQEMALAILIEMKTDWAVCEIETGLRGADEEFLIRALALLSELRFPLVTQICIENLGHGSADVRCAALRTLGLLGDESALPYLIQYATRRGFRKRDTEQQIAAIESLGLVGTPDLVACLEKIASRRVLLWRSRYDLVRIAAIRSACEIASRHSKTEAEAA
ncbi:MAG: HEAT repeat domain-containing protein [Armatimonadetes bacterium]|nr:HEAT repeat domain-containing protein [Armatimonadota bacterium]